MVYFLYQGGHGSHEARAKALSAVTFGSLVADVTSSVVGVTGLDTLAFWGHGDSLRLCGKTVDEMKTLIRAYKSLNAGLTTVELITCNARHCSSGDPYATRLKSSFGFWSGTGGLKVKALPTTVTGKNNAWSILLAETQYKSWVYVTAPGATDAELMKASSLITFEEYDGGKKRSFKGDIAQRADQVVRDHPNRQWTMNYGYLNTLRASLVTV